MCGWHGRESTRHVAKQSVPSRISRSLFNLFSEDELDSSVNHWVCKHEPFRLLPCRRWCSPCTRPLRFRDTPGSWPRWELASAPKCRACIHLKRKYQFILWWGRHFPKHADPVSFTNLRSLVTIYIPISARESHEANNNTVIPLRHNRE